MLTELNLFPINTMLLCEITHEYYNLTINWHIAKPKHPIAFFPLATKTLEESLVRETDLSPDE